MLRTLLLDVLLLFEVSHNNAIVVKYNRMPFENNSTGCDPNRHTCSTVPDFRLLSPLLETRLKLRPKLVERTRSKLPVGLWTRSAFEMLTD